MEIILNGEILGANDGFSTELIASKIYDYFYKSLKGTLHARLPR